MMYYRFLRGCLALLLTSCNAQIGAGTVLSDAAPDRMPATIDGNQESDAAAAVVDVAPDTAPVVYPQACADIYDDALLPAFNINISDENLNKLKDLFTNWAAHFTGISRCQDPARRACTLDSPCTSQAGFEVKQYVDITSFQYKNESYTGVQIRLKGTHYFSWSPSSPKMQFVVKFPKTQLFHGLRHIVLDAPWYDPSLMRERLATHFAHDVGLFAACANHARLSINGKYYGLYVNLELADEIFLKRNFPDPTGNLWKDGLNLEEGTDNGDLQELFRTFGISQLEAIGDVDEWVKEWALEGVIPHNDGYRCAVHNWLNYHDPIRGWQWILYDSDASFGWPFDYDPTMDPMTCENYGNTGCEAPKHFDAVMADPRYAQKYRTALRDYVKAYDPKILQGRMDTWNAQIKSAAQADPNKPGTSVWADGYLYNVGTRDEDFQKLRDFVARRHDFLVSYLNTPRNDAGVDAGPEAVDPAAPDGGADAAACPANPRAYATFTNIGSYGAKVDGVAITGMNRMTFEGAEGGFEVTNVEAPVYLRVAIGTCLPGTHDNKGGASVVIQMQVTEKGNVWTCRNDGDQDPADGHACIVTLTSYGFGSGAKIRGTFSGTLIANRANIMPSGRTITEGTFDLTIP